MRAKLMLLLKALGVNERWITIHPNGPDEKGQPILIQQQSDGSAKVIGGAGGALNHLRLSSVKSAESLKDSIKAKAKARREAHAKQKERDKALGLKEAKKDAHARVSAQARSVQNDYVRGVAEAMGWSKDEIAFDRSTAGNLSEEEIGKAERAHHAALVKRAREAVEANKANILRDAAARCEAQLGAVPLQTDDPNKVGVADLDKARPTATGLGFATDYAKRAEGKGLTQESLSEEAAAAKKPRADKPPAEGIAEAMALLRGENDAAEKLVPKIVDAKKAMDLIRLDKQRRIAEKRARDAHKKIHDALEIPKAFTVESEDAAKVEAAVKDEIANDLRTISTRAFLDEVGKSVANPVKNLARHIGVGAYNSVNALALAAGGAALVDRSVVDVLGIAGAAQVLARRLRTDLSPAEFESAKQGMQDYHLSHYMATSKEAIDRAKELHDVAKEIELGAADAGDDLTALQEINTRKGEAISESERVLGKALGEMEANAALVLAMKSPSDKPIEVPLGNVSVEAAIRQARAIGLRRGEYSLDSIAGNRVITIAPEGVVRLASPVSRGDIAQVRRNLDIIKGRYDEDGWLPEGVTDRPDLDLHVRPGVAPSLAVPFQPSGDLEQSIKDYIGGRAADGDPPGDILADLQSADFVRKAGPGRADAYLDALDKLAPLADENGKMRSADSLAPAFREMADEFIKSHYGVEVSPLHRQSFPVDDASVEALHRALAAEPAGVAAHKPIGEMTPQDQGALREWFATNVAKESPEGARARRDLEHAEANEPEQSTRDMFGDTVVNPEWQEWKSRRDGLAAQVSAAKLNWPKFVESMHGPQRAYAAVQDLVRSEISKSFAETYNALRPDAPLKIGRESVRNNLDFLDTVDPAAREARAAKEAALRDSLRNRVGGKYAAGAVRDKLDDRREQEAGFDAAQMGFFASDGDLAGSAAPAGDKPLEPGQRYTIGHEAERQIGKIMPEVGRNFQAGNPVRLFRPSMSGSKNIARQRAVKMIAANKRVVLSFGTGAGKTLIGLGAFTHLKTQGKAKRGLFLVPSIVQGQFGGEALRFLKPGKFSWHAKPGASQAERIAAYKDKSYDFAVMTHQAFRDDMVHLAATHAGVSEDEMSAKVAEMSRPERKAWMADLMKREGIDFDYMNVDEGHNTLDRKGKESSKLANVVDAASDNSPYYVSASADPVKNDASEAFSLLQKMDPDRYTDQAAFMRRYGVDTVAAKDDLRREMARFQFPHKIDPDVQARRIERKVPISDGQRSAMADIDQAANQAAIARSKGEVDVAAMRTLSPSSFRDVPVAEHRALAEKLQADAGILRNSAVRRVLDSHPDSPKLDDVVRVARERSGKAGVVFAHSLDAVEQLTARLQKEGIRVVSITGRDSAKSKEAKKQMFAPDQGEASADIMVASDAAAVGMNAQRGEYLINYDTPMTAMTHAQRNGRIHRTGQKNDVDLIDLVSDHPEEKKNRARLANKYALRDAMTTPMETLDDTGVAHFIRQRQIAASQGAEFP